jgi:hypothetical protein
MPSIGQEPYIGRDLGAVEFQFEASIEFDPESAVLRFTRWVRHDSPAGSVITHLFS